MVLILCSLSGYSQSEIIRYNIKNTALLGQIKQYISQVELENSEKVITLIVERVKEEHVVYMFYQTSAFAFTKRPPHAYTLVDDNYVLFTYAQNNLIDLNHTVLWQILKDHFPNQYDYYQKNDSFSPPMTGSVPIWRMTFRGDELQSIEEDIIFPFL